MWGGRLVLDPAIAERILEMQRAIAFELCSTIPTDGNAIAMEQWRLSLIASFPSDDCWTILPEQSVSARLADGEPGADIIIERIS